MERNEFGIDISQISTETKKLLIDSTWDEINNESGSVQNTSDELVPLIELIMKQISIAKTRNDQNSLIKLYFELAKIYTKSNQTKSIQYYENAFNLAKQLKDYFYLPIIVYKLARIYTIIENFNKAILYYDQYLSIISDIKADIDRDKIYYRITQAYTAMGDLDTALTYCNYHLYEGKDHDKQPIDPSVHVTNDLPPTSPVDNPSDINMDSDEYLSQSESCSDIESLLSPVESTKEFDFNTIYKDLCISLNAVTKTNISNQKDCMDQLHTPISRGIDVTNEINVDDVFELDNSTLEDPNHTESHPTEVNSHKDGKIKNRKKLILVKITTQINDKKSYVQTKIAPKPDKNAFIFSGKKWKEHNNKGVQFYGLQQYDMSVKLHEDNLNFIAKKLQDVDSCNLESESYINLGLALRKLKRYTEAITTFQKVLSLGVNCNNQLWQIIALYYLHDLHIWILKDLRELNVGKTLNANIKETWSNVVHYSKLRIELDKGANQSLTDLKAILNEYNKNYRWQDNIAINMYILQKAIEAESDPLQLRSHLNLAAEYLDRRKSNDALNHYKKALFLSRKVSQKDTEIRILYKLYQISYTKGNVTDAIEYLLKYTKILEKNKDISRCNNGYKILSEICAHACNYWRAMEYATKHLLFSKKLNNEAEIIVAENNLEKFKNCIKSSEFLNYENETYQQITEEKQAKMDIKCCSSLAETYVKSFKYHQAIDMYKKANNIAIGFKMDQSEIFRDLVNVYMKIRYYKKALEYQVKYTNSANVQSNPNIWLDAILDIVTIHRRSGDYENAFECAKQCIAKIKQMGNMECLKYAWKKIYNILSLHEITIPPTQEVPTIKSINTPTSCCFEPELLPADKMVQRDVLISNNKRKSTGNGNSRKKIRKI